MHRLQHTRLPCLYPLPEFAQTHPSSQWCHPPISSSVAHFSSHPQDFPASGSFSMSWLFASGGQSIGASPSVIPVNIQGWFSLGLNDWISLQSKGLLRVFSSTTVWKKHQFFGPQLSLWFNCSIQQKAFTLMGLRVGRVWLILVEIFFLFCCWVSLFDIKF